MASKEDKYRNAYQRTHDDEKKKRGDQSGSSQAGSLGSMFSLGLDAITGGKSSPLNKLNEALGGKKEDEKKKKR